MRLKGACSLGFAVAFGRFRDYASLPPALGSSSRPASNLGMKEGCLFGLQGAGNLDPKKKKTSNLGMKEGCLFWFTKGQGA